MRFTYWLNTLYNENSVYLLKRSLFSFVFCFQMAVFIFKKCFLLSDTKMPVVYTETICEIYIKNKYTNRTRVKNNSGIMCIL